MVIFQVTLLTPSLDEAGKTIEGEEKKLPERLWLAQIQRQCAETDSELKRKVGCDDLSVCLLDQKAYAEGLVVDLANSVHRRIRWIRGVAPFNTSHT